MTMIYNNNTLMRPYDWLMSLVAMSVCLALVWCQQNFTYTVSDSHMVIPARSDVQVSSMFIPRSDEYLSEGEFIITAKIYQEDSAVEFNLLYFNLTSDKGFTCYSKWSLSKEINATLACASIHISTSAPCMRYQGCTSDIIQIEMHLANGLGEQTLVVIENKGDISITFTSSVKMCLISSNAWFYWGIALTCFLLIMLVILTGVVFYWILKYKKTRKMYEHEKLTNNTDRDTAKTE